MSEVVHQAWLDLWRDVRRDVARTLSRGSRRDADEITRYLERRLDDDLRRLADHEHQRSRPTTSVHVTTRPLVVMVGVSWPGVLHQDWSLMMTYGSLYDLAADPAPRHDRYDARRQPLENARRLVDAVNYDWIRRPLKSPSDAGVDLLVRICRVIHDAVALQLAAALSLRLFHEIPRQRPNGRWLGLCVRHGLTWSNHSGARVGTCARCDAEIERARLAEWSVDWILRVAVALVSIEIERRRRAVEALVDLCLQAGAVLWESLGDWEKRVCLLETSSARPALEPVDDDSTRFQLLELH